MLYELKADDPGNTDKASEPVQTALLFPAQQSDEKQCDQDHRLNKRVAGQADSDDSVLQQHTDGVGDPCQNNLADSRPVFMKQLRRRNAFEEQEGKKDHCG